MHHHPLVCQNSQSHDTRFAAGIELGTSLNSCWSALIESSDVRTWLSGQVSSLPQGLSTESIESAGPRARQHCCVRLPCTVISHLI